MVAWSLRFHRRMSKNVNCENDNKVFQVSRVHMIKQLQVLATIIIVVGSPEKLVTLTGLMLVSTSLSQHFGSQFKTMDAHFIVVILFNYIQEIEDGMSFFLAEGLSFWVKMFVPDPHCVRSDVSPLTDVFPENFVIDVIFLEC